MTNKRPLTKEEGRDMMDVVEQITQQFTKADWLQAGYSLGFIDLVQGHRRLLQSLKFNDDDYADSVVEVIGEFVQRDKTNLPSLKAFISDKYSIPAVSDFISTAHTTGPPKRIVTFAPQVFAVPDKPQNDKLVTVMFPFKYGATFEAVRGVCDKLGLQCLKADDIWTNATFIQDIFELIFTSRVVVADFTGRNPNVFYEVGIAHTLGKTVVPLTQSLEDIPSDLTGHRALVYLNNGEGLAKMAEGLEKRLRELIPNDLPPNL
jgi:hypothetical protein